MKKKKSEEKYLTYSDINQARVSLKMILANYSWFDSVVIVNRDGWLLEVQINRSDSKIKDIVPNVHKDVPVHVNY